MSINIAGYSFEGPYTQTSSLKNQGGVYAVLTPSGNSYYKVLDAGESGAVRDRVEGHDRKRCWNRNASSGGIQYAVLYTPGMNADQRRAIEREIRKKYDPPCGEA